MMLIRGSISAIEFDCTEEVRAQRGSVDPPFDAAERGAKLRVGAQKNSQKTG